MSNHVTGFDLVARLRELPLLPQVVARLPAEMLQRLVRHAGLDACTDILTLATPSQVAAIVDIDLWLADTAGADHHFDTGRFVEWLEHLAQLEPAATARLIASIDPEIVVAGLAAHVRVFDPGTFMPTAQSDDEPFEVPEEHPDGSEDEIGGYVVKSRHTDGWNAVTGVLRSVESEDPALFHDLMRGCRDLSSGGRECDGLDSLLGDREQHRHDLDISRDDRRLERGYVSPADARIFLQAARTGGSNRSLGGHPAAAAFVSAEHAETPATHAADGADRCGDSLRAAVELLSEAGVIPETPRALLEAGQETAPLGPIKAALAFLGEHHHALFLRRAREMAFLANALAAGATVSGRAFTPQEASDAAIATCNLALEMWPEGWTAPATPAAVGSVRPDAGVLVHQDLISLFEIGWQHLHAIGLRTANRLIDVLAALRSGEPSTARETRQLAAKLARHRGGGTPWFALDSLDALTTLDLTACASLTGLLGECPVVPAALVAIVERRRGSIDARAFEFISTREQFRQIDRFLSLLPSLLGAG